MTALHTLYQSRYSKPLEGARYFLLLFLLWMIAGGILLWWEQERWIYQAINRQHTIPGDIMFSYLTHLGEGTVIGFVLLSLLFVPKLRKGRFLLALLVCNLGPFLLTQAVKNLINAPRPLKYFQEAEWINRVAGQPSNYNYSFPSGHSEGAFALFCFLSLLLPPRYRKWGIAFFLLALSVAYSRLYLSQHFYADVYVGSIIGTLCCLTSFALINPFRQDRHISKKHLQNEVTP